MAVKEYGVGLAVQYCAKNQFWWWLNHGMGWHQESTTFERATKESRNMSAATKERSDKRAPRQKSAATKERRDKLA
jgi:hypothetical protein